MTIRQSSYNEWLSKYSKAPPWYRSSLLERVTAPAMSLLKFNVLISLSASLPSSPHWQIGRGAVRGSAAASSPIGTLAIFVENHRLGNEGVLRSRMPQPKLFCESSKVLLEIVSVIGFVEILRKHLKQTVIIRLVPALERIQDDQATPRF